jgi:hypothetical protein
MEAVTSNQGIDGVKTGVAEKSHPKVEIAHIAVSRIQFTAGWIRSGGRVTDEVSYCTIIS